MAQEVTEALLNQEPWWFRLFNTIVMPRYQLVAMLIVFGIGITMAYRPVTDFHATERPIPLLTVTPKKVAEWGVTPTPVSIGLFILNFPVLDFVNNQFVFDGVIWFSFDPALISLDSVGKFSFEKGEILQKSEPYTQINDNRLFARYDIRVRFTADLEYLLFPFDDHSLNITVVNRIVQPSEMIYVSYASYFNLADKMSFSGWDIYGFSVRTGYSESVFDKYEQGRSLANPKAVFSIDFRRIGIRNILLILLPLFLIYFLSLFAFSFDPVNKSSTVLSISTAGVTSLLSYRFVIESMSPKVGYFVLSDRLFVLLLTLALVEFAFVVIMVSSSVFTRLLMVMRGALFIAMNLTILIAWYYFLFKTV